MSEKLKVIADFDAEFNAFFAEASTQPVVTFPAFEADDMDASEYADYVRSFHKLTAYFNDAAFCERYDEAFNAHAA